ncbi:hypothetical protein HYS72_02890 [Candidatus Pacearchaeota archaeon]|nr:hypothetical protein [Candidatus Pacearchaeota archaeon]MBI2056742.1 hypothetical protein [Candidatus Pacearchaeota archaeon]
MIKFDYNYPNYLIEKLEISDNTSENPFPHQEEFRSALHQAYFSNTPVKINEIANSLATYYVRNKKLDNQEAFRKALKDLNNYSESSDEFLNLKNKKDNIQKFFRNSLLKTAN